MAVIRRIIILAVWYPGAACGDEQLEWKDEIRENLMREMSAIKVNYKPFLQSW